MQQRLALRFTPHPSVRTVPDRPRATRQTGPRGTSIAARAAYARSLTDRLKVGGSINYIRDKIAETEMQTVSYDIGSNFQTGIYGTVLGMSITNFGPEVQYTGEDLSVQVADTIDVENVGVVVSR